MPLALSLFRGQGTLLSQMRSLGHPGPLPTGSTAKPHSSPSIRFLVTPQ